MSRSGASFAIAALAAVGALAFAAACKSSTSNNCGNGGTPPSLVGTYNLFSFTLGPLTSTAPPAGGTLRFYADQYGYDVAIPVSDSTRHFSDSGSYNIVGASCIQEFSVLGNPQFSGSFQLQGGNLRLSGTDGSEVAASLWKKTP